MKKVIGFIAVATLLACGGSEISSTDANTNEESSVVGNTNPDDGSINKETSNSDNSTDKVNDGKNTSIEYVDIKHDFGNVFYPSENLFTFKFKNTGSEPLIIENAKASCGCTIPNKPEEPILPGEMGEIDVIFRPKQTQVGQSVTKTITVTANTLPGETYLEITANVMDSM